jgi:recombinational DNA repair protein RecR
MLELGKLPGIGPKSAERITHFLLASGAKEVLALADAAI